MEYQYEAVKHHLDIPIKIFTHTVEQFPYHWHEDMEILFILKGSLEIRVDQKVYELKEGDLFLINHNEVHFINSNTEYGKTNLLALQFHADYFIKYKLDLHDRKFHLNSADSNKENDEAFDEIRYILADMMKLVLNKEPFYSIQIEKHLLEIASLLLCSFEVGELSSSQRSLKSDERLLEILKYINDHCTDNKMGLQLISEQFFLNPQYLSRYFKSHVGISFKKFVDNMRMNKSLKALRLSDDRVLDIALKFGFPDAKAYYRVFKDVMGMTPVAYREKHKIEISHNKPKDYFSINSKESLAKLFEYLNVRSHTAKPIMNVDEHIIVESKISGEPMEHNFTNLLTFGYAPHGLRSDFGNQLEQIQKEIGFKYVRFHGIFADELLVYNEKSNGDVYFNFNHIDVLLDKLIDNNLIPFIELGFMPKDLASTDETIFWWKSHISPPKNTDNWVALVEAFIKHIINRYGIREVRNWYFEFWNEPDVEKFFWKGTKEEFFHLFKASYDCIKGIDKDLRLGGFGNIIFMDTWTWLSDFNSFARMNNIKLDFFSFHVYNIMIDDEYDSSILESLIESFDKHENFIEMVRNHNVKIGDEGYITRSIDKMIDANRNMSSSSDECWITEWNSNTDGRDLVHDTCYMAAFIVKNVIENFKKVKGLGFWTFTDIFEEKRIEQPLFHGGYGLMTYNGIKKPSYHAFYFLSKLGNELLHKDKRMIVTRNGTDYQVIIHNYCHTNPLYNNLDYSQISMENRYDVFEIGNRIGLKIDLDGLHGSYRIEKYSVNRDYGSSFDAWVKMGAPMKLTTDAHKYLTSKSEPDYLVWEEAFKGSKSIETQLAPHEIQLLLITMQY